MERWLSTATSNVGQSRVGVGVERTACLPMVHQVAVKADSDHSLALRYSGQRATVTRQWTWRLACS